MAFEQPVCPQSSWWCRLGACPIRLVLPGLGPLWGAGSGPGGPCRRALWPLPQVIQQPPKPGALIRPPQVTLTQTPMVALRQPHSRIVLTTPQQIQLNQLQPGEPRSWASSRTEAEGAAREAARVVCGSGGGSGVGSAGACTGHPVSAVSGLSSPAAASPGLQEVRRGQMLPRPRCALLLGLELVTRCGEKHHRSGLGAVALPSAHPALERAARPRAQRLRVPAQWHTLVSCFAVPVVKPAVLPGTKALSAVSAQAAAAQKNKLKEPGGGSFR